MPPHAFHLLPPTTSATNSIISLLACHICLHGSPFNNTDTVGLSPAVLQPQPCMLTRRSLHTFMSATERAETNGTFWCTANAELALAHTRVDQIPPLNRLCHEYNRLYFAAS